ncbi:hypothetical protein [Fundidesulfovibrio soli]|uniref:hypothetical protein n=1 Tax=Fundidesulfovibrio soli TaxID=2922716 RepID=UPI001FAFB2F6|nr:hypothetical protein [Fundidesulfovibrio soli]
MSNACNNVICDLSRVFSFEHWARFYYTVERDGKTFLEVPAEVVEECRKKHPDLAPLLDETNNQELTYESSCQNVGAFVCRLYDGERYGPGVVTKTIDSKDFRIELHMFGLWLKGHENYLDEHNVDFDTWLEMFTEWNKLEQVAAYRTRLMESSAADTPAGEKTVH